MKDTINSLERRLDRLISWPFLNGPEFVGARNLISRAKKHLLLFPRESDHQKRLFEDSDKKVDEFNELFNFKAINLSGASLHCSGDVCRTRHGAIARGATLLIKGLLLNMMVVLCQ